MSVFTTSQFAFQILSKQYCILKSEEKQFTFVNAVMLIPSLAPLRQVWCHRETANNRTKYSPKRYCAHTHTHRHTYVLRCINEHPYFPLWLQCNVQFNGLRFLNGCFMCMGLLCIYQPEAHLIRQLSLILD